MADRNTQSSLSVENLSVAFQTSSGLRNVVDSVSFNIARGEQVGVVGESGSGKSVTMLAAMGLLPGSARIVADHIRIDGEDVAGASESRMAQIRGSDISMVFQNPMTSLNTSMRIGPQVSEPVAVHRPSVSRSDLSDLAITMLTEVGVPNPELRVTQYPHEFSGGMRQRAVIAMALSGEPSILVADEPTTALDVTVQAQIVSVMRELSRKHDVASVVITHDLGLVAELVDRVLVMYAGRIVEETPVVDLFENPGHPYTRALLKSRPTATEEKGRLDAIPGLPPQSADAVSGCPFHPRCEFAKNREICRAETPPLVEIGPNRRSACHFVDEVLAADTKRLPLAASAASDAEAGSDTVLELDNVSKTYGSVRALNEVSLTLARGETLGIAGESGCGKSTLARMAMGLAPPTSGRVLVNGREISALKGRELREARREIQMVFQDPTSSLDRRMTIRQIIAEPMSVAGWKRVRIAARTSELMEAVSLAEHYLDRMPNELSGGQRQRVGIARALALSPDVIILDEPTSALDVSVQAQIVNLLDDLRAARSAGYVFIAHDLGVLRHVSDRVAVMYLGRIVEIGDGDALFDDPRHPYTRALLASTPAAHPNDRNVEKFVVSGSPPDPANIPSGCGFRLRCPLAKEICAEKRPELQSVSRHRHQVACHFGDDLSSLEALPTIQSAKHQSQDTQP
ncbi:MAG: ABC transporter ATP-binding protein [Rhizobiaceae bacterium]|nr:ABC transporter ATP-binding protein [Rhizobiaceae bacterium]